MPGASTPSETDEAGLECGWAAAGAGAKGAGAEHGAESDDASRPSTLVATEVDGAAELSEREEERRAARTSKLPTLAEEAGGLGRSAVGAGSEGVGAESGARPDDDAVEPPSAAREGGGEGGDPTESPAEEKSMGISAVSSAGDEGLASTATAGAGADAAKAARDAASSVSNARIRFAIASAASAMAVAGRGKGLRLSLYVREALQKKNFPSKRTGGSPGGACGRVGGSPRVEIE